MATGHETVRGRFEAARVALTPWQLALGLAVLATVGGVLVGLQEPAVHHALHDFRHVAGVTCH